MPHFDFSINISSLLAVVVFLAGQIKAHADNKSRLEKIETKVDLIYGWFQRNIINHKE